MDKYFKFKLTSDWLIIHIEFDWFIPVYFIGMSIIIYYMLKYRQTLNDKNNEKVR